MAVNVNARETALKIISEVDTAGAYANIALSHELGRNRLSDLDRRFMTELVYGTIKTGKTLDWILSCYSRRPLNQIPSIILNILRMAIFQIFFLSKVPPSAACNQAVELAKKYGHIGTAKFVNGILRNAARQPNKASYPDRDKNPLEYLSLKFFHPEWLVARWLNRFGLIECEALCQANNLTPPLSLRANTLKIDRDQLLEQLSMEGVDCVASTWVPEGVLCRDFPALGSLSSLQEGLFQIQDESSMLVAHVLAPQPGEFIIDACGAPGGKSTHIAALMNNRGKVLSVDLYEHKLMLTRENASRLGITIIETKLLDATILDTLYAGKADRVLVDAPCSGLGVIRRKADSRWRKSESMLAELPKLQLAILLSAADCVKPGGVLVYSTCTTEPEENENIIDAFLAYRSDFSLQKTGAFLPVTRSETMIQLWPHHDGVDGFFIVRMAKRGV